MNDLDRKQSIPTVLPNYEDLRLKLTSKVIKELANQDYVGGDGFNARLCHQGIRRRYPDMSCPLLAILPNTREEGLPNNNSN